MSCRHAKASVHRATLVQRGDKKFLRTVCPDCRNFVDTVPKINRDGSVQATEWVTTDHVIVEHEFDPKETVRHV